MADSAPSDKLLQAGDRMIAAGAIQCCATVLPENAGRFTGSPVLFNAMAHTEGESIPPTDDSKVKFNYEVSFTNKMPHEASGDIISTPPKRASRSTWSQDVPQGLKDEISTVMRHTYGCWANDLQIEGFRMCWDAVTPTQDWIIAQHPPSDRLYLATGGSFHSWKFMPTIGRYVVQMLQGMLPEELASRWAWDRPTSGGALPEYLPRRDLKEIAGYIS